MAYLDLAAAPPKPALGLADIGPAACLAGELTLLPAIMAAPAQVLPQPHRCSSLWLLKVWIRNLSFLGRLECTSLQALPSSDGVC